MRNAVKNLAWNILSVVRNALDPLVNFREVSILCYHSTSQSAHETAVVPQALDSHLTILKRRGYVFVSLADIVAWAKGERALPRKAVALTFDDGYADFETEALPLLKKFQAPGAVFVIGEPAAATYRTDDMPLLSQDALERLHKEPLVEIGYHSKTHPNLARMTQGDLEKEVTPPFPARYFAYPGGNHSPEATQALRAAGYEAAFTIRPVLVRPGIDPHLLPRSVILKNMTPRQVAQRTTKAADWYYRLTHLRS